MEITQAYECFNCGFVYGECKEVDYCSNKRSWEAMAGREGKHFHCSVCDSQLGSHYWRFS